MFCLLSWCGQVDSVKCKPSKKCNKQGGECLGPREEVPEGADYLGRCKGKCKCYKRSNPVSTSKFAWDLSPCATFVILRVHCVHCQWARPGQALSVSIQGGEEGLQ